MPSNLKRTLGYLFYSVWAVAMTALTYVLGAVSLKVLRSRFGRTGYWLLNSAVALILVAAQLPILGLAFFSLVILIGVFSELEEMGISFGWSLFFTMMINGLLAAGSFAIWVYSTGSRWSTRVMENLEAIFKPLVTMNPQLEINYFEMMLVLPSLILILWMGSVYLSILLESRLTSALEGRENGNKTAMRQQLGELRLPDMVIWLFIGSLLATFGAWDIKPVEVIGANTLNICLMLFFFQGVAVVSRFFESLRMSPFWQTLFVLLLVVYLFLFVSLIGLMDYWLDFRARIGKRTEEFNREV
jgi:hypothetical protein